MRLLPAATLVVAAFWCGSASAQGQPCYGVGVLGAGEAAPTLAIVAPAGRLHFVKGGEEAGCPGASAACAMGAFVVGGDAVVVSTTSGDYACVTFTGPAPKAVSTSGFLPHAQLAAPPPEKPVNVSAAWTGEWRSGDEQTITIKPKGDGRIVVHGDATYGGHDPERVKRGAVNAGQIEAEVSIADGAAAFASDGDGTTQPFEFKGPNDDDVCRVKLWRLGPYLVAADNVRCGGMNVSFTGVYRKAKRAAGMLTRVPVMTDR
jgi:hypothetical protein